MLVGSVRRKGLRDNGRACWVGGNREVFAGCWAVGAGQKRGQEILLLQSLAVRAKPRRRGARLHSKVKVVTEV